ncbi:hypothetical protein N4G70_21835 [Streptomyces sp. ASQP_92]|uniref:hypothetical protein n=1 Tax=Streptomyces sp. ASQP_92 TaxID=2979116 RepID=UPI0021C0C345|nr:hypothetical protein [Streptomyces sp. ASQP_92]MCT9091487.1 hypothetical protein [Streptomyces sp. ASQP_92]
MIVLSWIHTLSFGFFGFLMTQIDHGSRGGLMSGAASCFGTIAIVRRIFGARVILDRQVTVINPVFTYRIPYSSIKEVVVNGGGSLVICGIDGGLTYVSAFNGSLIDKFVGSSLKAAGSIDERRHEERRRAGKSESSSRPSRSVSRAWVADAFLAAAIFCAVCAGIIGI